MKKTENELIILTQVHPDGSVASSSMKELRERFDNTYDWCMDCDGIVCKQKDCCLNREDLNEDIGF